MQQRRTGVRAGRRAGKVGLVGLALGAALATGCGASLPTSSEAAATETAETVCEMLRRWNNDLSETLNATSQSITDDDDPATAGGVLVAGFDEMIDLATSHRDEVDDLDLPASTERDALLAELADGADESVAVLRAERSEAEALSTVEVADQRGVLGAAFIGVERATSVLEPSIGAYDDEALREAFATDEGCEHVIQPF